MKALLALEDGRIFNGRSFTGHGEAWGEAVFNTSMTGYQEIVTDPSYSGQMVTMTCPLIGNYGVNHDDVESGKIHARALLVKEYQGYPSNFRSRMSLGEYLSGQGVLGVEDFDTRALVRHIRKSGALRAFVSTTDLDPASCVARARKVPSMKGRDMTGSVTTTQPFLWRDGQPFFLNDGDLKAQMDQWRADDPRPFVTLLDFGVKYNILRHLDRVGIKTLILPADTDAETVMELKPDGVFLSNGPGDPEPVTNAIETVKRLLGFAPMFGICLGHQILGLALGGTTHKMKFGHRGGNQPVKNLITGRVEITSQNHGFALDMDSLTGKEMELTHINLNDDTVEGFRNTELRVMAVQYHPEASPGPLDATYMFDEFLDMIRL